MQAKTICVDQTAPNNQFSSSQALPPVWMLVLVFNLSISPLPLFKLHFHFAATFWTFLFEYLTHISKSRLPYRILLSSLPNSILSQWAFFLSNVASLFSQNWGYLAQYVYVLFSCSVNHPLQCHGAMFVVGMVVIIKKTRMHIVL